MNNAKDSKDILIVLSQYVPLQNPNVYRWQAIAEYWQNKGFQIHVITTSRQGSPAFEVINGVKVYREGHNTLYDWLQSKLGSTSKRNEVSSLGVVSKPSFFRRSIERVLNATYRKRYWPDGSFMWIKPALKRIDKEFQTKELNVVLSVGLPFSAHIIGRTLKEKESSLHWLMDIEDPFCYSKELWVNNFKRYDSKNIEEEKKAFELADSVSLTNNRARERYLELFPKAASKSVVIPPLHTLPTNFKKERSEKSGNKKMVFVGSFYENVRNPKFYLELIQHMRDHNSKEYMGWDFEFYGQQNPWTLSIFETFKSVKRIKIFGLKTRSEVFNVLKNADIIVNISNRTDYHLPSKLVDYIWSGKPIINFFTAAKDQSKSFLSDYPMVCNLQEQNEFSEKVYEQFISFIRESENKALDQNQIDDLLSDYQLEVISKRYLDLFKY